MRIAIDKLDAVMRQVEELLSPRLAATQRVVDLSSTLGMVSEHMKGRAKLRPALRRLEKQVERSRMAPGSRKDLSAILDHLEREHLFLANLENRLMGMNRTANRDQRALVAMTDVLLRDVKELQLSPFSSLFDLMPRVVRDLAREQGKKVELKIDGGEIEIDRRILETLKDPLIHLLRNAIDHGIESPAKRAQAGKSETGTVDLTVAQLDSGKVEVQVRDDGAGVDVHRVRQAAAKLGLADMSEDLPGEGHEPLSLIFNSGLSTSPIITDISGRGLGLAIVLENVERLGGHARVESQPGTGTVFHLVLPLALATLRGLLVRTGEYFSVIPTAGIERVTRVPAQGIGTVENRATIVLDGRVVSLASLAAVLELPPVMPAEQGTHITVVVLVREATSIAFRVDEVLGEQEILVKPLGPQLARVRNISGASMLGNGQVVPVLNVADLLKSAVRQVVPEVPYASAGQTHPQIRHAVLVAEDSITSRSLLKGILESAGYAVTTAVDGMDAYMALKSGDFELLVSDVEMPRMDGFDLTAKVRADKRLAELPVVLVTALESREHRERGIEVGANAYIVKSNFDQSNLLETMRRLI